MGKILRTVNLIVNALKPKQVTWRLNEDGTGYIAEEKEMENKFDIELVNPTTEELEIPFETYLTSSRIPWCGPKKEVKPLINNTSLANPRFIREELAREKMADLEMRRRLLILLEELKPKKQIEKEPKMNISSSEKCRFTREDLRRAKKKDFELRKRRHAF